jgi:hypothetical protein
MPKKKTHLFCIIFRLTVLGKIQDGGWNFFFLKAQWDILEASPIE